MKATKEEAKKKKTRGPRIYRLLSEGLRIITSKRTIKEIEPM